MNQLAHMTTAQREHYASVMERLSGKCRGRMHDFLMGAARTARGDHYGWELPRT